MKSSLEKILRFSLANVILFSVKVCWRARAHGLIFHFNQKTARCGYSGISKWFCLSRKTADAPRARWREEEKQKKRGGRAGSIVCWLPPSRTAFQPGKILCNVSSRDYKYRAVRRENNDNSLHPLSLTCGISVPRSLKTSLYLLQFIFFFSHVRAQTHMLRYTPLLALSAKSLTNYHEKKNIVLSFALSLASSLAGLLW